MIILDMGSANWNRNDKAKIKRMIDEVNSVVPESAKRDIVLKWQLFKDSIGGNEPLIHESYDYAVKYAQEFKFMTTASVFDPTSLQIAMQYPCPFIKLACGMVPVTPLLAYIPRGMKVLYSASDMIGLIALPKMMTWGQDVGMCCVPQYPAKLEDYEAIFPPQVLQESVSDHTTGLELWEKYHPQVWEKHFCVEHTADLDCGEYAVTAAELQTVFLKSVSQVWKK